LSANAGTSREDAHAIAIKLEEDKENIVMAKLNRGDVSIHSAYCLQYCDSRLARGIA